MNVSKKVIIKVSIIIVIILMGLLLLLALNKTNLFKIVKNNINSMKKEEIETQVKCEITNVNELNTKTLLIFENLNGIEKITDGELSIQCNGRKKVALDKELILNKTYPMSIKLVGKETEEKCTIIVSAFPDIVISNIDTTGDGSTKTVRIDYTANEEECNNLYSLDDGETWMPYTEELDILEKQNVTLIGKSEPKAEKVVGKLIQTFIPGEHLSLVISTSLLEATDKAVMKNDTYYRVAIKDQEYRVHTYVENGDTTFTSNKTYGNANDAGTASGNATTMEIIKVNGNLVINSGVTVTSYGTAYGGTKGMLLYVTGNLENNGTITMSARGAKAAGQNVYLWKNEAKANSYEYVPAIGAAGGAAVYSLAGNNGGAGTARKTGGGGSGGSARPGYNPGTSGRGGNGTSYSGGSGGGAARNATAQQGNDNGGAGGNAARPNNYGSGSGGGAGNPGGTNSTGQITASPGANGTGGLLILYGNTIHNKGAIVSNGMNGGQGEAAGGGASGGGSINIFFKESITKGTIAATGGTGGPSYSSFWGRAGNPGGAGGNGSISTGSISTGTYISN